MVDLHLPATFKPTHETGGLPGFPAIDIFGPAGAFVTAPEDGNIVWPHFIPWDQTKRIGGWTCYYGTQIDTPHEEWYFWTHLASLRERGSYHKGGVVGILAQVPGSWWAAHVHQGKHKAPYKPAHS